MHLSHLRGRKVNDLVLRKGNVWKGKTMLIRWIPAAPRHPAAHPSRPALYVGTLASAKLHKSAVVRNRMRRRCREALRLVVKDLQPGALAAPFQLLVCPRSASLDSLFDVLLADIRTFLTSLTAWQRNPPRNPRDSSSTR